LGSITKTLHEIRSEACNAILIAFTLIAIPAVGSSLLRGLEQGFRPIMALHVLLLAMLAAATIFRKRLPLTLRAGIVTAVPFLVATAGLVTYGRGNGVMMFYVTSVVVAGCFFARRTALAIVGLCLATVTAVYASYRFDLLAIPLNPTAFDMTTLSWVAFSLGFLAAAIAPLIGLSAVLRLLDAERERADLAVQAREDFLANMSHEIRTPMAGIMGMAEVLKSTPLSEQQQSLISNLTLSARTLLGVLNDVLDFAKFETGQIPIENAPFRISEIIQNVHAVFENRAAQKGLALRIDQPPAADLIVGDALRIGQVVTNLVDNAIKFTPRGSVVVRLELKTRGEDASDLIVSVTDTGIGIAPKDIERIFEPFIQADMSTSRAQAGTGLGLSICRHLVDAMGGALNVTSAAGSGTTFTLTIPVQRAAPMPVPMVRAPERQTPQMPVRSTKTPLRVLVVDDDKNMRTLADIMLLRRGYEVVLVEDGPSAIDAARIASYDCIIVDMHMPVMNGRDVMRAIQAVEMQGSGRRTPMIALTADVMPEHVKAFVDAGADAVVAKPVDWTQLDAKIVELTQRRMAAQAC